MVVCPQPVTSSNEDSPNALSNLEADSLGTLTALGDFTVGDTTLHRKSSDASGGETRIMSG